MSKQTPLWAMRRCRFCTGSASAECQSWDNEHQKLCQAPICPGHTRRRASLMMCPVHAGGARKREEQPTLTQATFDFTTNVNREEVRPSKNNLLAFPP